MDWTNLPAGIPETLHLLTDLDTCFSSGFSRLGPHQAEALAKLTRAFTGSPLGDPLRDATDALMRSEFREEHFITLAIARASLHGAIHDGLLEQATEALPHTLVSADTTPSEPPSPAVENWMGSTRAWLLEIALSGFAQLHQDSILPFLATLQGLQEHGEAARQAMLLTGIVHELLDALPVNPDALPARRWADLWTRAMLGTIRSPSTPTTEEVSGTLRLFGAELRHHTHAVSAVFHGLLETEETPQVVTITASTYKVDVITDLELWGCFDSSWSMLLEAFHKNLELELQGITKLSTGGLLWDPERVTTGPKHNLLDTAKAHFSLDADAILTPRPAPEDRHPVHIALPVYLERYTCTQDALEIEEGVSLPLDLVRVEETSALASGIEGTKRCVGLLRFDASTWRLTPLVATKSKKLLMSVPPSWPIKAATVNTLKERASRLLRKKS